MKELQVIQKIGLCVRMYDLLKVSDGLIGHGDGFVNVNGTEMPTPPGPSSSWSYQTMKQEGNKRVESELM